jgi:hypothetical protein
MIGVHLFERHAQSHIDPALTQHPHRGIAKLLTHLGHHVLGQVQQHKPHRSRVKAHLFGRVVGQRAQLQHQLGPRVGRTDHDNRAPRPPASGVLVNGCQFKLFEHMITQIQRFCGGLQPARIFGQPGHIKQACHRARRQHQSIPRHRAQPVFGIGEDKRVRLHINAVHPAAHRPHPVERSGQRDRHKSAIDHPACHIGQKRRIEQVVDRRNDRHIDIGGTAPPQPARQATRTLKPGEPATDNDNRRHQRDSVYSGNHMVSRMACTTSSCVLVATPSATAA